MQKFETALDKFYEKAAVYAGSTISQTLFLISFVAYNFYGGWVYINVISELAISLALLLLRGQTVQAERMEANLKRTKKDTKTDLDKSDEVIKKLDSVLE